jgi:hypothetical protein
MSDIPMKDLPETVVETVDENEDDHRGEKSMMGLVNRPCRKSKIPSLNPDNLVDRRSSCLPKEDGTRVRAKSSVSTSTRTECWMIRPSRRDSKFQCIVNDDYEDVVAYNDIVDYIER